MEIVKISVGQVLILLLFIVVGYTLGKTKIAIILGAAWGLSGLPVPSVIGTTLSKASGCMGPVSMLLMGIDPTVTTVALLVLAMPCGMNTIVFPKLVGEDCRTGAALTCVTSILCCITIPLCLWLFGITA